MIKYDFDEIIERKNTNSFKWDMNEEFYGNKDAIPMWVADMDFKCAPPITEALIERAKHPIYGYSIRSKEFIDSVLGWLKKRHNFDCDKSWLCFAPPGVIFAIYELLDILTEKGDKVIINEPNYDPLFDVVRKNDRVLIESSLINNKGYFEIDFDGFSKLMKEHKPKVFIMSSPNNPTGRVWKRDELLKLANICLDNHCFMIVDEIHADIVEKDYNHIPFASLGNEIAENCAVLYSANKGFNLGGLGMSSIVIKNEDIRNKFNDKMMLAQTRLDTCFGLVATYTAYTDEECENWLNQMLSYVRENKKIVKEFFSENYSKVKVYESEGTYFAWLDFTEIGLKGKELEEFLAQKAGVSMCAGYEFGESGEYYARMNLATQRKRVVDALNGILKAIKESAY